MEFWDACRNEKLEQYTRRDNLLITGIKESREEVTDIIATDVARSIGVELGDRDLNVA
jgi:hypothetical protein